jgi:hypothetical protein
MARLRALPLPNGEVELAPQQRGRARCRELELLLFSFCLARCLASATEV